MGVALLSCMCSRAKTVHLVLCLPNSEGEELRSGLVDKREEPRSGYESTVRYDGAWVISGAHNPISS